MWNGREADSVKGRGALRRWFSLRLGRDRVHGGLVDAGGSGIGGFRRQRGGGGEKGQSEGEEGLSEEHRGDRRRMDRAVSSSRCGGISY